MNKGKNILSFICLWALLFCVSCASIGKEVAKSERSSEILAKCAAENSYREATKGLVKKYECYLARESKTAWFFVCTNQDAVPRLDTDGSVTVSKKTFSTRVILGG